MAQPGVRLLAIDLGGFDQAVDLRAGGGTFRRVAEQPVLAADDERADAAFCKVVGASAVFLSCYFQCRLLPLWVERDGADGLPIPRRA